jgi:hypothetical protein
MTQLDLTYLDFQRHVTEASQSGLTERHPSYIGPRGTVQRGKLLRFITVADLQTFNLTRRFTFTLIIFGWSLLSSIFLTLHFLLE